MPAAHRTDKKGSQRELAPKNPTTDTTKEVEIMSTTIAPAVHSKPSATEAELQAYAGTPRHVWQTLFLHISMIRPDWEPEKIAESTFNFRYKYTFPELSAIAIRVAHDQRAKGPGAIGLTAAGVLAL
jgi:hypothetical protein